MRINISPAARLALLALALIPVAARASLPPEDGPESAPLAFARVSLATGVELHYAAQGDPAGPAVILLHGYSDSWFSFSGLMPLLPEGYRVYAVTQRGHGDSDRPPEMSNYSMTIFGRQALALLDHLVEGLRAKLRRERGLPAPPRRWAGCAR